MNQVGVPFKWRTFDFTFYEEVSRHPKIAISQAYQLLQICAHFCLNDLGLATSVHKTLLNIFKSHGDKSEEPLGESAKNMNELDSTEINHFAMEIVDKLLTFILMLENVQLEGT
jgi:hypothetical protein